MRYDREYFAANVYNTYNTDNQQQPNDVFG
jgi:hypothetical protein